MSNNFKDQSEHDEWLRKIQEASAMAKPLDLKKKKNDSEEEKNIGGNSTKFIILFCVFLLALIPRLVYLFILSNPNIPGWYTDVFHHWQIAYLSKEVGFSHGFLRLWDFKGMEFFWGLLHPLVLVILFTLTGSISILVPRLLAVVGGSISIVLLFLIIKRYFNSKTAWATVLFASFFPITLFSNTSGMQEELGMPLILLGILLWPESPLIIGILLGLASMVRAEFWLFSAGLVLSTFLLRKNIDKALILFLSYLLIIAVYMKYLATYTGGNYIYPIYWNFLANSVGVWSENVPVVGMKLVAKYINEAIFAFGVIGGLLTLWKKPKYAFFFLFGFANIVLIGYTIGLSAYVKGYFHRFWLDRFYNWPYLFTAILIFIFLFYTLPKKLPFFDKFKLNWIILICMIAASQFIWKPINFYMGDMISMFNDEKKDAAVIASAYRRGVILLPEDRPFLTYFLAHDHGISGKNIEGQMFDPFYYFKGDPFSNWGEDRKVVLGWLKKDNIKLIVLTGAKVSYTMLIGREPETFEMISSFPNGRIYEVKDININ